MSAVHASGGQSAPVIQCGTQDWSRIASQNVSSGKCVPAGGSVLLVGQFFSLDSVGGRHMRSPFGRHFSFDKTGQAIGE